MSGDFKIIMTLLIVYVFFGLFGEPFGLKTNLLEDVFSISEPEKPTIFNVVIGGLSFLFDLLLLPVRVLLSDIPEFIKLIFTILTLMGEIEFVLVIRGRG